MRFIWITIGLIGLLFTTVGVCWASKPSQSLYPMLPKPALTPNAAHRQEDGVQSSDQAAVELLFHQGYAHYAAKRYAKAGRDLYQYLSQRSPDDSDFEWAEFFFGLSLQKMGFSHAAVDTLTSVLVRKPNPKIVSYALEVLEAISRSGPFDRNLLINRGVCDHSYGFVDDVVADFVHYYQGEYDWEHGLFPWGDEHFAKIRPHTYYYHKYLFKKALRALYDDDIEQAIALLKQILVKLPDGEALKDDVRKTLARLYYETGQFDKADFLYQQIEMNIVQQAQNLLERAWAHYRLGNAQRAMGLLYSFEAPSYTNSFTPEFYILKSFIYKDVCHYKKAIQVLEQFKGRYGGALERVYDRGRAQDNPAMLLVILNKPKVNRMWRLLNLLEKEQNRAAQLWDEALKQYLDRLYALKRSEYEERLRRLITESYEKMANNMLRFEEEAHLMEYEIGLDMYQRVYSYHPLQEGASSENEEEQLYGKAVYRFQGEFWNDELNAYEVTLPNKCQNAEEWDIFFK